MYVQFSDLTTLFIEFDNMYMCESLANLFFVCFVLFCSLTIVPAHSPLLETNSYSHHKSLFFAFFSYCAFQPNE